MSTTTNSSKAIAKSIIGFRESKGLSQEALAVQLGKSQSYIAKIESGHRKVGLIEYLQICATLDILFDEISRELTVMYNTIQLKSIWSSNGN